MHKPLIHARKRWIAQSNVATFRLRGRFSFCPREYAPHLECADSRFEYIIIIGRRCCHPKFDSSRQIFAFFALRSKHSKGFIVSIGKFFADGVVSRNYCDFHLPESPGPIISGVMHTRTPKPAATNAHDRSSPAGTRAASRARASPPASVVWTKSRRPKRSTR